MIVVTCDHEDCGESVEIGVADGDWSTAPDSVQHYALAGLDYSVIIYLYLPMGWGVDRVNGGFNEVIHCPEHHDA